MMHMSTFMTKSNNLGFAPSEDSDQFNKWAQWVVKTYKTGKMPSLSMSLDLSSSGSNYNLHMNVTSLCIFLNP